MQLILMFAALVTLLVLPVMFSARMVGAEKTGFGAALLAVIFQIVLSGLVEQVAPNSLIAVAIAITGFVGPVFGYPNLADTVPALLLLIRDGALIAAIVLAIVELGEPRLLGQSCPESGPRNATPEK